MGSCLEAIFGQKLTLKQQSLLSRTTPQQLNYIIGIKNYPTDSFYCFTDLSKIQELLDRYYKNMNFQMNQNNFVAPDTLLNDADHKLLKVYLKNLKQFLNQMKNKNSSIYNRLLYDKEQCKQFYLKKDVKTQKTINKKESNSYSKNIGLKRKQTKVAQQIKQNNIIIAKIQLEMLITKPGRKTIQIYLQNNKIWEFQLCNPNHQSLNSESTKEKSQHTNKQLSTNQKNGNLSKVTHQSMQSYYQSSKILSDNQLQTYELNKLLKFVTTQHSKLLIKIPQMNISASISLFDLIYHQSSIVLSDFIPLKRKDQQNNVLGYIKLSTQTFLYDRLDEDYQNIQKQHNMISKQLQSILNNQWQKLYELKNSSASYSHKQLHRQQSIYSELPKESAQFELKLQ